jgi:tRNA1Val (adenine37-N6)-methyltransferase
MPNHYFEFKQFRVEQDQCAMKVCTDACLFGAWTVSKMKELNIDAKSVLDIGTGTGLLSLMMAQSNEAIIDAVEIESGAAIQAAANFQLSKWNHRLKVIHANVQSLHDSTPCYDFIISNPPFYEQDLKSPDSNKNLAHHSAALGLEAFAASVNTLLHPNGYFAVLLPYNRKAIFLTIAENQGFFLAESMDVQQTENHPHFRTMMLLSRKKQAAKNSSMIIKINNAYSPAFRALLTPYYLPF